MLLKKDDPNKAKIDFQDMESLFCQQTEQKSASQPNNAGKFF